MTKEKTKLIIDSFNKIRDMPYYINTAPMDYSQYIDYCRTNKKGSCTPKHLYLAHILKSKGISVEYHASLFRWKDIPLDYPFSMKNDVAELSPTIHLSLIIRDYEKTDNSLFLDASWDPKLRGIGVTINNIILKDSGLIESTPNAVIPLSEKIFNNPYDYLNYVNISRIKDEKKKHFYYELNKWFKEVRQKNGKTME